MPVAPSEDFLTKKVGILPVWGWGGIGLSIAYLYSRYKADHSSSSTSTTSSTTGAAGESTAAVPQFIIENNEQPWSAASTPVTTAPTPPVTVTTPPGTGTTPPVTTSLPISGGAPPQNPGLPGPISSGPAPTPTPAPPKSPTPTPSAQKYTVQHGDTLWGIAQKEYGNGADYMTIWNYNLNPANRPGLPKVQGTNPNLIYPGEVFVIPPK